MNSCSFVHFFKQGGLSMTEIHPEHAHIIAQTKANMPSDDVLTQTAVSEQSKSIYRALALEQRALKEVAAAFGVSYDAVKKVKTTCAREPKTATPQIGFISFLENSIPMENNNKDTPISARAFNAPSKE